MNHKNNILMLLAANKFDETEFLTVKKFIDKSHFNLFITSDANSLCTGNSGLKIKADVSFFNIHTGNFISLIIIGGQGIRNYWNNQLLHKIINNFHKEQKLIAAICSAPVLLARSGVLTGKKATCFPTDKNELEKENVIYVNQPVVTDNNLITAQGPNAAPQFIETVLNRLKQNI